MIPVPKTTRRFFVVLLALWAAPAWADVLELRDGQTLTGQYAGGSKEEIRFQVGSQTLRSPLAEVSRVTIGAAAQTDFQRAAKDALRQLKALASVTEGGTTYQNYSARVEDAKVKIDQFLDEYKTSPLSQFNASIVDSLGFHVAASSAWNVKVARTGYKNLINQPYILKCAPLQTALTSDPARPKISEREALDFHDGYSIAEFGFPILWQCARNALIDAEKALGR